MENKIASPTLSVLVYVRDNEPILDKCLSSVVGIADELIVVNNASIDASKAIALKYTDKVYDLDDRLFCVHNKGFEALNNYGLGFCKCDWIFLIDADEVLTNPESVKEAISSNKSKAYTIKIRDIIFKDHHNHFSWYPEVETYPGEYQVGARRLWKNHEGIYWKGLIHLELFLKDGTNTYNIANNPDIKIDHYGFTKMPWFRWRKTRLYSKLLLRGYENKELREGINPQWFEKYVPEQIEYIRKHAREHELFYEEDDSFRSGALEDLSEYLGIPRDVLMEAGPENTKKLAKKWLDGDKNHIKFYTERVGGLLLAEIVHWHQTSGGVEKYLEITKMVTQGTTVLDYGCGIGTYSLTLAKLGFDVTAYDINPQVVEFARWRSKKYGLNIDFHCLDYDTVMSKQYDTAIAIEVLNFAEDPTTILKDLHKALKPSGLLLFSGRFNDAEGKIPQRNPDEKFIKNFEEEKNKLFWVMGSHPDKPQILLKRR